MKMLIVDDSRINRKMMSKILEDFGECDTAENGLEAIKAILESWKNQQSYDLIFMDIMMPVLTGVEALQKIRDMEKKQGISKDQQLKIIMVTAKGDKASIIDTAKAGGVSGYLVKPIQKEALHNEIKKLGFSLK